MLTATSLKNSFHRACRTPFELTTIASESFSLGLAALSHKCPPSTQAQSIIFRITLCVLLWQVNRALSNRDLLIAHLIVQFLMSLLPSSFPASLRAVPSESRVCWLLGPVCPAIGKLTKTHSFCYINAECHEVRSANRANNPPKFTGIRSLSG